MLNYNNIGRRLVPINGRAYVYLSLGDLLLVDADKRYSYPVFHSSFTSIPCRFVVEMQGYISIRPDCDYQVWPVGDFEKFYISETAPQAQYPTMPTYKAFANGGGSAWAPGGETHVIWTIGLNLAVPPYTGLGPLNAQSIQVKVLASDPRPFNNGMELPLALRDMRGFGRRKILDAALSEFGISYYINPYASEF